MGFLNRLFRWLLGWPAAAPEATARPAAARRSTFDSPPDSRHERAATGSEVSVAIANRRPAAPRERGPVKLEPTRRTLDSKMRPRVRLRTADPPYLFANLTPGETTYLDLSTDCDPAKLARFDLPVLRTPEDLAAWLQIPVGQLAWLTNRFSENRRPQSKKEAHYHFHWVAKKRGGFRLIEAPKSSLKDVQTLILDGILNRVPAHPSAHGFVRGRSAVTNARPHAGQRFVLKLDLEQFYPSVRFSRVVAIFRGLGYSREVALWLARLTTSAIPTNLETPRGAASALWDYIPRHLPQGAPTSPALANLSAYPLDVRLTGLAATYHLRFTRYADDLTFSGTGRVIPALREVIPLVGEIVREQRFRLNRAKRKVLRRHRRMVVTGVVVNRKVNVCRRDFDELKAILHNCVKHGPSQQNRAGHADFASHLRGRIAHVLQLNPTKGGKLLALFQQIDWRS